MSAQMRDVTNAYQQEVLRDEKLLQKRLVSLVKLMLKSVLNLLLQSESFIDAVGKEQFAELECYKHLSELVKVAKIKQESGKTTEDKSVQTEFENDEVQNQSETCEEQSNESDKACVDLSPKCGKN